MKHQKKKKKKDLLLLPNKLTNKYLMLVTPKNTVHHFSKTKNKNWLNKQK